MSEIKGDLLVGRDLTVENNAEVTQDLSLPSLTPDKALIIDNTGKVDSSVTTATELSYLSGVTSNVQDQLDDKQNLSEKGQPNGYAPLDINSKVPVANLPNAIMEYQGNWDASTNTPSLADGVGNADEAIGNVYRVNVAGTQDLGSGSQSFEVGDYAILNSSKVWEKANTNDDVANRTLSNLNNPTAINQDLIFNKSTDAEIRTPDDILLSSKGISIYSGNSASAGLNTGSASLGTGDTLDSTSGQVNLWTGNTDSGTTGQILLETGAAFAGGTTGDVNIKTGTTSGQRGLIYQEADGIYLYSIGTSHPTGLDLYAQKQIFIYGDDEIVVQSGIDKDLTLKTDVSGGVTSGDVLIETGNGTGTASDSGNITIKTGTADILNGGQRGFITLDADYIIIDGNIDANSHLIQDVQDPLSSQDAATKNYVDTTAQPLDTQLTDLSLLDYTGNANKVIAVKATEDGFELVSPTSGANTTLSNLTSPTSVNEDLIPSATTKNLGSTTLPWSINYLKTGLYSIPTLGTFTIGNYNSTTTKSIRLTSSVTAMPVNTNSGASSILSGDATGTGNSGVINLSSGTVVDGTSGDISLTVGTVSGTGSKGNVNIYNDVGLRFFESTNTNYTALKAPTTPTNVTFKLPSADGSSGDVLQTNGSGELSFVTISSGANTTLSNLTSPTAINQDLIFNKAVAEFKTKDDTSADSAPLTIGTGTTVGSAFASGTIILKTGNTTSNTTGDMSIATGDSATGNTGNLTIGTGTPSISGNSGNINITTSTASGGNRGEVNLTASNITLTPDVAVKILSEKSLSFFDSDNTNSVSLRSPTVVTSDVTFVLPGVDGANGDVLQTDGFGGLTFVTPIVYAAQDLSNLTGPTAINETLLPGTSLAINLGASNKIFIEQHTAHNYLYTDLNSPGTLMASVSADIENNAPLMGWLTGTGVSYLTLGTAQTAIGSPNDLFIIGEDIIFDATSDIFVNNRLQAVSTPTATTDAVNKSYSDSGHMSTVSKTANYTATATDNLIRCDATSGSFTITLPAAASNNTKVYTIKKTDSSANTVTIDGNASETLDGATTKVLTTQYESITIVCNGTSWDLI